MARFSSAEKQAKRIGRSLHKSGAVQSLRTANGYAGALALYGQWLEERGIQLGLATRDNAVAYLDYRSEQVGQAALNLDRQAINSFRTATLGQDDVIGMVRSEATTALKSRAYTPEQIQLVMEHQSPANRFATELAAAAGLRTHELLTLRPVAERAPSDRDWDPLTHMKIQGNRYTVVGKGGLVRTVKIPYAMAEALEKLRLETPRTVLDRKIRYVQHYNLPGGNNLSKSFSDASKRALGWSTGIHGLRHTYAQQRMSLLCQEFQKGSGLMGRDRALQIVSHEMGHLRPEITLVYLR